MFLSFLHILQKIGFLEVLKMGIGVANNFIVEAKSLATEALLWAKAVKYGG